MDRSDNPLVSVVIPAYNHERFVEQAVRSIWEQTYRPIELIILDDGSSDGTPQVIERLLPSSPVPTKFIRKNNEGVSRTLNRGVAEASGEWITFISSDDFFAPDRIAEQIGLAWKLGLEYGVMHSDAYLVDEGGTIFSSTYQNATLPPARGDCFYDLALHRAQMNGCTIMVRAALLREIGGYDEKLASEDFDLHLRLARVTRFGFVDKPLTHVRCLSASFGRSPHLWIEDGYKILAKHEDALGDLYPEVLRVKNLRNFAVSLFNNYPSGALRYGIRAIGTSRSFGTARHTVLSLAVTFFGYTFKRVFYRVLPSRVEAGIRRVVRHLIIT